MLCLSPIGPGAKPAFLGFAIPTKALSLAWIVHRNFTVKLQLTKDKTVEIRLPGGGGSKSATDIAGVEMFSPDCDGCPAVRLIKKKILRLIPVGVSISLNLTSCSFRMQMIHILIHGNTNMHWHLTSLV